METRILKQLADCRMWIPHRKEMLYPPFDLHISDKGIATVINDIEDYKGLVYMGFSGLSDVNRRKIYAGDIVIEGLYLYDSLNDLSIYEIIFIEGSYKFKYLGDVGTGLLDLKKKWIEDSYIEDMEDITVMGNKYESTIKSILSKAKSEYKNL